MVKKYKNWLTILACFMLLFTLMQPLELNGCTLIMAGKRATADGSVLLAHNNDLAGNSGSLISILPAQTHTPDEKITFKSGLQIPQVSSTYRILIMYCYYGYSEGDAVAINEYQVAIAGGIALADDQNREAQEADPLIETGVSGYARYLALERAKTARECVEIIGDMYSRYGIAYPSGFGVADPNEVWYVETGGGKCWAAQRIRDDEYMVVTNGYRLGAIDFNDKNNFIYPPYLKTMVVEKGLWKRDEKEFNFAKIFGGKKESENDFYNARRVWRTEQLLTPSLKQDPESFSHPVTLKPDKPITLEDLTAILRDYYMDTPYDASENALREPGTEERAIAVFNTVHTSVIQLRGQMPPEIGAVMWAGVGASLTTPYIPLYLGIKEIPPAYGISGPQFDENSAFWRFRTLTTLLELRFSTLINEILPVWQAMESRILAMQPGVEKEILNLYRKDKEAALDFLTVYSNGLLLKALDTAKELMGKIESQLAKTSGGF